jgi:uncharacterized protein YyaL (SSP411 family)
MKLLLHSIGMLAFAALLVSCTASAVNTNASAADGMKWQQWSDAYPSALEEQKIIIVDLYTDWCGWCKVMDRETYGKKSVQNAINNGFVAVKLNPEIQGVKYRFEGKEYSGQELVSVLVNGRLQGYPTTLFVLPNRKVLSQAGYLKENEFIQLLKEVSAQVKGTR